MRCNDDLWLPVLCLRMDRGHCLRQVLAVSLALYLRCLAVLQPRVADVAEEANFSPEFAVIKSRNETAVFAAFKSRSETKSSRCDKAPQRRMLGSVY